MMITIRCMKNSGGGLSMAYSEKYVQKWIRYLNGIDRDMGRLAPEKLAKTGDPSVVPELINSLINRPDDIRINAARALGVIGDSRAVTPLCYLLKDENPLVASTAADALGEIADPGGVAGLIKVLREYKTGRNRLAQIHGYERGVYIAAANALKRIGTPDARAALDRYYRA